MANIGNEPLSNIFQRILQISASGEIADVTGSGTGVSLPGGGEIVAKTYTVSSSVTNVTFQQQSGSTIFGDTSDDTHTFIGNITASGTITASRYYIGPSTYIEPYGNGMKFAAPVTSTFLFPDRFKLGSTTYYNYITFNEAGSIGLVGASKVYFAGDGMSQFSHHSIAFDAEDGHITASGDISASGTITADNYGGNISGSGTSTGSFGQIVTNGQYSIFPIDVATGEGDIGLRIQNKSSAAAGTEAGLLFQCTTANTNYQYGTAQISAIRSANSPGTEANTSLVFKNMQDNILTEILRLTGSLVETSGSLSVGTLGNQIGDITASGDISSSGTGSFGTIYLGGSSLPTTDSGLSTGSIWISGSGGGAASGSGYLMIAGIHG